MLQLKDFAYNVVCFVLYLLQIENYIVENMKSEMAQIQQNAVQNHTATMLEIGTSLLSQTAEQTRKLTDVETQVHPWATVVKLLTQMIFFPLTYSINTEHISALGLGKHIHFCLLVITTVTAWHAMHVSFDFMRVDIFSFVCACKNRTRTVCMCFQKQAKDLISI